MTTLGLTHTASAVLALASGAAVLLTAKGTTRHRMLGWTYVGSMVVLDLTALFIFRLFGGFGPFHAFAVVSVVTVAAGAIAARRARRHRRQRDAVARSRAVEQHFAWMTWSYVGLAAATVSEIATRVPALRPRPGQGVAFAVTVAIATVLVVAAGARLIRRHRLSVLAPYRPRPEPDRIARAG